LSLGCDYYMHYQHLVAHPISVNQIFEYLPAGISYGLNITKDEFVMRTLQPYDARRRLGYIKTLAYCYTPKDKLEELGAKLFILKSGLYNNPEKPVRNLMRSEEHTSELQSRENLVCRLLLEKKKKKKIHLQTI